MMQVLILMMMPARAMYMLVADLFRNRRAHAGDGGGKQ